MRRPSKYWNKPENRLKKCSERRVPTCDHDATDDCCEVIACTYCLIWETYGENPEYGEARLPDGGNAWDGSVGPISFRAFWERGYESGECEFVVEANGEEVYRKSCYEGQSCRDSSDEAAVSIPYAEGTLTWSKDLKRPLPHVTDYGTTCKRRWCGDCECTCKCLCVTVTDPDGNVSTGDLCDANYDCDGPVWAGTVGGVYISASLEADEYTGECYLAIDADYEEFDQDVIDCTAISFSFEMYDGTVVEGACKTCDGCVEAPCQFGCCPGANVEDTVLTWDSQESGSGNGCPSMGTGPADPTYQMAPNSPDDPDYEGLFDGACLVFRSLGADGFITTGLFAGQKFDVVLACGGRGDEITAYIRYKDGTNVPGIPANTWIETAGGWECPDCDNATGEMKDVRLWFEIYVACTECKSEDYVYDPVEGCAPDVVYNLRWYFKGGATCL